MYSRFGLVLMVNHACNLRCTYCYTGLKFSRAMSTEIAHKSIERAVASLDSNGVLELGFFGGEPLVEAALILECIAFARQLCAVSGMSLVLSMTTNGTIDTALAWQVMAHPELDLAVSFDGLPEIHDRHRRDADGRGSSAQVLTTMQRLRAMGKTSQVIMVVRPDSVEAMPDGLRFLRDQGVDLVTPSLDLWTTWNAQHLVLLETALAKSAGLWRESLPGFGVSWFNEKAVQLARVPLTETARCGFGQGEIAVSPAGNLYPCERLIGEDSDSNVMRLPGHALRGHDFLNPMPTIRPACSAESCGLSCACSNFVRSGKTDQPDELLSLLDRICLRETRRVLATALV